MLFAGTIEKSGKYWAINVDDLSLTTQGKTREDAFKMLQDSVEMLLDDDQDRDLAKIEFFEDDKKSFAMRFKDTDAMLPFILERLCFGSRLSIGDGLLKRKGL